MTRVRFTRDHEIVLDGKPIGRLHPDWHCGRRIWRVNLHGQELESIYHQHFDGGFFISLAGAKYQVRQALEGGE